MHQPTLTIGELAKRACVTPDTLRYYERLSLIPPPSRSNGGYRLYEPAVTERVAFIRKARGLGLTLDDVREILRLADAGTPPCEHARNSLARRLREVEARLAELESLRHTLARALRRSRSRPLAQSCLCQIIESQALLQPDGQRAPTGRRRPPGRNRTHHHHEDS